MFAYYKQQADAAIAQFSEEEIFWQPNSASNSVAIIMQHMAGNMLSCFTEFLTSDGEKTWRNRDAEFSNQFSDKGLLLEYWEKTGPASFKL